MTLDLKTVLFLSAAFCEAAKRSFDVYKDFLLDGHIPLATIGPQDLREKIDECQEYLKQMSDILTNIVSKDELGEADTLK